MGNQRNNQRYAAQLNWPLFNELYNSANLPESMLPVVRNFWEHGARVREQELLKSDDYARQIVDIALKSWARALRLARFNLILCCANAVVMTGWMYQLLRA